MPLTLIKTAEVILTITLPKWANKNNGLTYMLPIKPNFCWKHKKHFSCPKLVSTNVCPLSGLTRIFWYAQLMIRTLP
jgi:hypothetical protein